MEHIVEIDTGESVAFSYDLAGLGSRFLAVFIDLTVQIAIALSIALAIFFGAVLLAGRRFPVNAEALKLSGGMLLGLVIFALFMLFFGYFIFFEWLWQGRTPGKRIIGIRVVRDGGFPLDFTSSVIRNVVRMLEVGVGFYAVAAISALLSPQNKRLGDFAAGTIVVWDNYFETYKAESYVDRDFVLRDETDDPAVGALSLRERELIRSFVARREMIALSARSELVASIARRIRPRLGVNFDYLDDDALLTHLARTALTGC